MVSAAQIITACWKSTAVGGPGIGWDGVDVEILAFCGESADDLRSGMAQIPGATLRGTISRNRARKSRERIPGRGKISAADPHFQKGTAFSTLREAALMMLLPKQPEKNSWVLPNGIAFGSGEKRGKLGALFPGQGSQYPGMLAVIWRVNSPRCWIRWRMAIAFLCQ